MLTEKVPLRDYSMVLAIASSLSFLRRSRSHPHFSSLLPEIVSKDGQTRPYRRPWRASGQHSTQRELAFEHTDPRFHPTAEPLQSPKPLLVLMPSFSGTQTTDLRVGIPEEFRGQYTAIPPCYSLQLRSFGKPRPSRCRIYRLKRNKYP